jgi:hypothetical protein
MFTSGSGREGEAMHHHHNNDNPDDRITHDHVGPRDHTHTVNDHIQHSPHIFNERDYGPAHYDHDHE